MEPCYNIEQAATPGQATYFTAILFHNWAVTLLSCSIAMLSCYITNELSCYITNELFTQNKVSSFTSSQVRDSCWLKCWRMKCLSTDQLYCPKEGGKWFKKIRSMILLGPTFESGCTFPSPFSSYCQLCAKYSARYLYHLFSWCRLVYLGRPTSWQL